MSTWDDSWGSKPEPECGHLETWFSRTICPEPCGSMHNICVECGLPSEGCAVQDKVEEAQQREAALLAEVMDQLRWDLDEFPSPSLKDLVDRFDGYIKERK